MAIEVTRHFSNKAAQFVSEIIGSAVFYNSHTGLTFSIWRKKMIKGEGNRNAEKVQGVRGEKYQPVMG